MLGDDHLAHSLKAVALFVCRDVIVLWPVEEHYHVGILLYGTRFPQIRELRTLIPAPYLYGPAQLAQRYNGHIQFLGDVFQCSRYRCNFLLPVSATALAAIARHELEVVDDDQLHVVLCYQLSGLCPQFQDGECRCIVNKNRCFGELGGFMNELLPFIFFQLPFFNLFAIQLSLRRDQPVDQLNAGHFQRKYRHSSFKIYGSIAHCRDNKSGIVGHRHVLQQEKPVSVYFKAIVVIYLVKFYLYTCMPPVDR